MLNTASLHQMLFKVESVYWNNGLRTWKHLLNSTNIFRIWWNAFNLSSADFRTSHLYASSLHDPTQTKLCSSNYSHSSKHRHFSCRFLVTEFFHLLCREVNLYRSWYNYKQSKDIFNMILSNYRINVKVLDCL